MARKRRPSQSETRPRSSKVRQFFGSRRYPTIYYVLAFSILSLISYLYLLPWASSHAPTFKSTQPKSDSPKVPLARLAEDTTRKNAVVDAFKYAWNAYERDAMGSDEYHPISHQGSNMSTSGGIGYTIADALDTMVIMGLDDEYKRARRWMKESLSFDREGNFNVFETTIRVLGGLLATHHLTGDDLYLEHAMDLADRMLPSFNTVSGLPLPSIDLKKRKGIPDQWSPHLISTAEASTLQLEWRYLAQLTSNQEYWYKVEKVMTIIDKARLPNNLVPIYMSAEHGSFAQSEIRLGSRGDSYYEYLLKQYLQTNQSEPVYDKMYKDAMQGIHDNLIQKTLKKKMTYTAELIPQRTADGGLQWSRSAKQDHLVCFLAGSLMLGATTSGAIKQPVSIPPRPEELSPEGQRDWKTGVDLLETCMYTHETATGLSPEIVQFKTSGDGSASSDRDWYIKNSRPGGPSGYDARYMLRPETVESLFIAWRLTGDIRYRKYSWAIFSAINEHCRVASGGFATVLDVDTVPVTLEDKQETFFLSETLKYLYLTFTDDTIIPLHDYVFNTEAHPLPVFKSSIKPKFQ